MVSPLLLRAGVNYQVRHRWQACLADGESDKVYPWSFDPFVMDRFRTPRQSAERVVDEKHEKGPAEGEPVAFEERQAALAELMEIGG